MRPHLKGKVPISCCVLAIKALDSDIQRLSSYKGIML